MGVGFAKDGESAMRNNRKLKNATKDKYFKNQKFKSNKSNTLNNKPASEEELKRVRNKIELQNGRANKRGFIAEIITFLFLIYIFFFANFG